MFDIFDSTFSNGRGGFVSANVRDEMLKRARARSGIDKVTGRTKILRRVRQCLMGSFKSPMELRDLLYKDDCGLSVYTMKGEERSEGFYVRLDDEKTGLLKARCKIVHGSFHQSLSKGRWERNRNGDNKIRPDLWIGLNDDGVREGSSSNDDDDDDDEKREERR